MAADRKQGTPEGMRQTMTGQWSNPSWFPANLKKYTDPMVNPGHSKELPQQACGDDMAGGHVGCHAGAADMNPCLRMPAGQGLTILVPCGVVRDHIKHTHEA